MPHAAQATAPRFKNLARVPHRSLSCGPGMKRIKQDEYLAALEREDVVPGGSLECHAARTGPPTVWMRLVTAGGTVRHFVTTEVDDPDAVRRGLKEAYLEAWHADSLRAGRSVVR